MTHKLTQEKRDKLAKMYAELVVYEFLEEVTPEHEPLPGGEERTTFDYGFAVGELCQFSRTMDMLEIEFDNLYTSHDYDLRVLYISADKYFTRTNATFSLDNQTYSVYDWDSTREKWEIAISRAKKIAKDLGQEDYPMFWGTLPQAEIKEINT